MYRWHPLARTWRFLIQPILLSLGMPITHNRIDDGSFYTTLMRCEVRKPEVRVCFARENHKMAEDSNLCSFAVFPFLKTTAPVTIGGITLRSTSDTTDLSADQARHVNEIAEMLFLQDHLRIRSASYARVPFVDLDRPDEDYATLEDLADLQAVVAYCYGSPHTIFGDPFFRYEHASLALFSPGRVSIYVVRPEHHADWVGPEDVLEKDHREEVEGYKGLYNFKHHFWVTKGSRLYPPVPHIGLNISQDMAADLGQFL